MVAVCLPAESADVCAVRVMFPLLRSSVITPVVSESFSHEASLDAFQLIDVIPEFQMEKSSDTLLPVVPFISITRNGASITGSGSCPE